MLVFLPHCQETLTDNLTPDVAINPDFRPDEADAWQANLTRFSLFFPEKGRFFQERYSGYEFSLGGVTRLFHSRRTSLIQGERVRSLEKGCRVGRIGDRDVGS
ncbi:MAG: DUF5916 domain-containing protein [Bacteroidota bacterium]